MWDVGVGTLSGAGGGARMISSRRASGQRLGEVHVEGQEKSLERDVNKRHIRLARPHNQSNQKRT